MCVISCSTLLDYTCQTFFSISTDDDVRNDDQGIFRGALREKKKKKKEDDILFDLRTILSRHVCKKRHSQKKKEREIIAKQVLVCLNTTKRPFDKTSHTSVWSILLCSV